MDKSIPAGARLLLDFIGSIEAPKGYDTIYANKQHLLVKPITQMTIDEVIAAQPTWSKRYGSSASGRYQFMRATLQRLKQKHQIPGSTQFAPLLQDALAYALLEERGYLSFVVGKTTRTNFGLQLAQEWASFPVLKAVKGAHRQVARGETYYAGDKLNKSLVTPERIEELLDQVFAIENKPVPAPIPDAPGHDIDPAPPIPLQPLDDQIDIPWWTYLIGLIAVAGICLVLILPFL